MPSRIIRDGIIESVAVNALPWDAELFYRRLMSVVDDYGRYSALPQLLVSRCYPLQVDKVKPAQISKWLSLCSENDLITLYECEKGKPLLEINQFNQRTRTPSKFAENPQNLVNSNKCITNDGQMTVEDEDEVECVYDTKGKKKPKPKAKKKETFISNEWKPTDSHRQRAVELSIPIDEAAEFYMNWCRGKGVTQVCWNSAFTNALNGWLGRRMKEEARERRKTPSDIPLDPLGKPLKKWR